MKKFLALLTLLLFVLLVWFSWQWYKDSILCCGDAAITNETEQKLIAPAVTEPEPEVKKYGPLVFNWNDAEPITNDLWPDKKAEILSAVADSKVLKITGPYYSDEENNTDFENLGKARAEKVKLLLQDSTFTAEIETAGKLVRENDTVQTEPFGGTVMEWQTRNENVQEIDDKALIYFPYNSSKKLENENINNYLRDVAENLKGNDHMVLLTGYTDSKGNAPSNKRLGLYRAEAIRNLLVGMGVAENRVKVSSKGEEDPIATNKTEEGRAKNRRVELQIQEN